MDPLVFNIMTSDSESSSGSAMKSHPGDCAAPLEVLEWLDKFDEKVESTSYGQVRRGQIPAALLRTTEPKDLSAMPPLTVGTGMWRSAAIKSRRNSFSTITVPEVRRDPWRTQPREPPDLSRNRTKNRWLSPLSP